MNASQSMAMHRSPCSATQSKRRPPGVEGQGGILVVAVDVCMSLPGNGAHDGPMILQCNSCWSEPDLLGVLDVVCEIIDCDGSQVVPLCKLQ